MKSQKLFYAFAFILALFFPVISQTSEAENLIEEAKKNAIATAQRHYIEFASDWKRSAIKPNGKTFSQTFELICSNKHCEHIKIEENGKKFSAKKIRKNRRQASKRLIATESVSLNQTDKTNRQYGYSFAAATVFNKKIGSIFSPFLYLKICKTEFLENSQIENRPTVKVRSYACDINDEAGKQAILYMPQTEAVIWIDKADKTIVKFEVFDKPDAETLVNFNAPLITAETVKVPEGFWFWKKVKINAIGNERFFPDSYGNWQIDFFNYKKFNVDIEKVEIGKKLN